MTNVPVGCNPAGPFREENAMKLPNVTANDWSGACAVHRDARQVLSNGEIHDFFVEHLKGTNLLVKMFRIDGFRQKILETSEHKTPCGRKFRVTTEYDGSITTLELINEH